MAKPPHRAVGRALRRVAYSNESYALLPDGTWNAGGCWTLAAAFKRWAGPRAELVSVASPRNATEHVVVKVGDAYYDADGAQTRDALLRKMERIERVPAPNLEPFRRSRAGEIKCPRDTVTKLEHLLSKRLGKSPFK